MNIDLFELLTFCSVREVVVIRAICDGYKPQEIARAHNTTSRKVQQVRDHAIRRMRRIIIQDLNLKPTHP